jgi:hypothetical protein
MSLDILKGKFEEGEEKERKNMIELRKEEVESYMHF